MRKILAILVLGLCSCDSSSAGGTRQVNGANWTQIPCPSWQATSGLYKIIDPDNGNTVYLHLGKSESSLFVVPKAQRPVER